MNGFYFLLTISAFAIVSIYATSEPYTPERARREKASYCRDFKEIQAKLPAKYQAPYNHVQSVLCKDSKVTTADIVKYLDDSFTSHEQTEIRILSVGKPKYCEFVLGLDQIWPKSGGASQDASKITTPEYLQLKQACADSTKDVGAILPLVIKLSEIYYHF